MLEVVEYEQEPLLLQVGSKELAGSSAPHLSQPEDLDHGSVSLNVELEYAWQNSNNRR